MSAGSDRGNVARVDANRPEPEILERAAEIIRRGGLVAFPTETVYGIGANALSEDAVARIFAAKGRPPTNPLIVHVSDAAAARELVASWPDGAERLAQAFWPGPLTLVLPKRPIVGPVVTAGLHTLAVRVPSHPVAQGLLRYAGVPIAAPSANPFMRLSPTSAEHVVKGLSDSVDLVLDAGPASVGIESTVVSLSGGTPQLLRPGTIPPRAIEEVLGTRLEMPGAFAEGAARPAPGMLERHYSPRAVLRIIPADGQERLAELMAKNATERRQVGLLLIELGEPAGAAIVQRLPADPALYARRMYAILHEMDDRGVDLILVEQPPAGSEWDGVRDRLRRAATADEGS